MKEDLCRFKKLQHLASKRYMVRKEGVEPSRENPYASEAYAYANSATSAIAVK